jgi:hypothetical protein
MLVFIGVVLAIIFYRAADYEQFHPLAWAAASVGITGLVALGNRGGGLLALGQVGLFAAMWAGNIWRHNRSRPRR